jgi:peptide/nickel transport system permease protein
MTTYIVGRVLLLLPVLLGITIFSFLLIHLIPGDPAATILGITATPQQIGSLDRQLGLDRPLPIQFLDYVLRVLQGDFGVSITLHQSVVSLIGFALPNTIQLAAASVLITVLIALPLGVAAAVFRNSPVDIASIIVAQLGISMPIFWLGTLLVEAFAFKLAVVPSFGIGPALLPSVSALFGGKAGPIGSYLSHLLLPALTLGLAGVGIVSRMVRTTMIEVLGQDYIRTARAKGLTRGTVIWRHGLRNALLPVVTILGLQIGYLLGGAVIVESIFAWPGIGRLTVNAILARDFPLVQGCVLVIATMFALVNLIVDVSYAIIDPRIGHR